MLPMGQGHLPPPHRILGERREGRAGGGRSWKLECGVGVPTTTAAARGAGGHGWNEPIGQWQFRPQISPLSNLGPKSAPQQDPQNKPRGSAK